MKVKRDKKHTKTRLVNKNYAYESNQIMYFKKGIWLESMDISKPHKNPLGRVEPIKLISVFYINIYLS